MRADTLKVSTKALFRKDIYGLKRILDNFSVLASPVPGLPLTPPGKWAWNPSGKRESPILLAGACSE